MNPGEQRASTARRVREETFSLISMWDTPRNEDLARDNRYLLDALAENKREGGRLALRARFVGLVAAAILVATGVPFPDVIWLWGFLAVFAILGWVQHRIGSVGQSRAEASMLMLDVVLLVAMITLPNPLSSDPFPPAATYQVGAFQFLYVFLAAVALAYSWRTIFYFGTVTVLTWMVGVFLVWFFVSDDEAMRAALLTAIGGNVNLLDEIDVTAVGWGSRIQEVVIFAIVTIILGVNAFRMNRLLLRQAEATRERANLARYFPPTTVEALARREVSLTDVRQQNVAVIFADIVGFTTFAERTGPEETIAFLRDFHVRIEATVFAHGGTLEKFLGDGVMVTFGTPETRPDDPARAVACIRDLAVIGLDHGLRVAVGGHYGPAVLGDIGSERRLEFATIGDTVNVAARLEEATRENETRALVSNELIEAAGTSEGFECADPLPLRGRTEPCSVWRLHP